jgi:hypothetical protein
MIATICSSVKRALRIAPSESGANLSRNSWSEIPGAGHPGRSRDGSGLLVSHFLSGQISRSYASTNCRDRCATYQTVCGKRATLLDNADRANRNPRRGLELNNGRNVKRSAIRAWGQYHSRILDRWAANTGRLEGATAEKAVPFPCAARRSVVLRLAEASSDKIKRLHRLVRHRHESTTTSRGQNEHRARQLGSRLCGRSARASAPMRDWSRPSVIFERFLPWSRVACAVAH